MRRFLLLFLAFVLPLQMSWAAAHICDDERMVKHAIEVAERGHDHADAAAGSTDEQAGQIADACCSAAHGCHGLHHLMSPAAPYVASHFATQVPQDAGASPPLGETLTRIERPNWPAA